MSMKTYTFFSVFLISSVISLSIFSNNNPITYTVVPISSLPHTENGCTPLPAHLLPQSNWLGMLKEGNCSLSTKYNNLKDSGASGILLLTNNSTLNNLSSSTFHIIPIDQSTYNTLLSIYKRELTFPSIRIKSSTFPTLQILYILFLILMIFVFPNLFDQLSTQPIKLVRPKDLLSLSLDQYSSLKENIKKYEECPICFEYFTKEEFIRTLQCKHYYHSKCIDPWLLNMSCRCPVCNQELSFSEQSLKNL